MSLADELDAARYKPPSQIDKWLAEWLPTLSKEDRATFDNWLADPEKSPTQLHRVLKRRGLTVGESGFIKWARAQREA